MGCVVVASPSMLFYHVFWSLIGTAQFWVLDIFVGTLSLSDRLNPFRDVFVMFFLNMEYLIGHVGTSVWLDLPSPWLAVFFFCHGWWVVGLGRLQINDILIFTTETIGKLSGWQQFWYSGGLTAVTYLILPEYFPLDSLDSLESWSVDVTCDCTMWHIELFIPLQCTC